MKMPAAFEFLDAAPLANPAANAFAATIRPRDIAAPLASPVKAHWTAQKSKALAAAVLVHASLLAGILAWRQSGGSAPAFEEIPIEIVVEAPSPEPVTPVQQAAVEQPAQEVARSEPPAAPVEPPVESTAAPPPAREEPVAATLAPPPSSPVAPDATLVAQEKARIEKARAEAQRRIEEAARRKREEAARQRQVEKLEAERETRAEERRVAEKERRADERRAEAKRNADSAQRESRANERRRVASLAPPQGAGVGASHGDAFDAASYRQIVARAVSAAVARACPSSGGGRVVVALTIGASGRIAGASLSGASGNGALDSAAVAAVRRAGPFPAPVGRSSVSVPVAVTCR